MLRQLRQSLNDVGEMLRGLLRILRDSLMFSESLQRWRRSVVLPAPRELKWVSGRDAFGVVRILGGSVGILSRLVTEAKFFNVLRYSSEIAEDWRSVSFWRVEMGYWAGCFRGGEDSRRFGGDPPATRLLATSVRVLRILSLFQRPADKVSRLSKYSTDWYLI